MKDQIRKYLQEHRATEGATKFSDSESLLEAGVIDSMTMLDLINHVEKTYGIKVDEDDMTPENFDTVDAIVTYIQKKQS